MLYPFFFHGKNAKPERIKIKCKCGYRGLSAEKNSTRCPMCDEVVHQKNVQAFYVVLSIVVAAAIWTLLILKHT